MATPQMQLSAASWFYAALTGARLHPDPDVAAARTRRALEIRASDGVTAAVAYLDSLGPVVQTAAGVEAVRLKIRALELEGARRSVLGVRPQAVGHGDRAPHFGFRGGL